MSKRIRAASATIALAVTRPLVGLYRAVHPDSDAETVLDLGLGLLAIGLYFVYPPLAAIVPGAILTAFALGFTFRRPT